MQRSLSSSLRIRNPAELGEEDSIKEEGEEEDSPSEEEEEEEQGGVIPQHSHADPNYSPRKSCAEQVASFELKAVRENEDNNNVDEKVVETTVKVEEQEEKKSGEIKLVRALLDGTLETVKGVLEEQTPATRISMLNHVNPKDGFSPLMVAVSCEQDKIDKKLVTYLIESGARKDAVDKKGNTSLHWASLHGQSQVLEQLMLGMESLGRPNSSGDTPLHLASRAGHTECVRIFLNMLYPHKNLLAASEKDDETPTKEEKPDEQVKMEDGEKAMDGLWLKKRGDQVAETLAKIKETPQNETVPHEILLKRNDECETAFDVAGMEVLRPRSHLSKRQHEVRLELREDIHELFFAASEYFKTLVLHHASCFDHIPVGEADRDVWEAPERLHYILGAIAEMKTEGITLSSEFEKVSMEKLKRAHSSKYVDFVFRLGEEIPITAPVPFTPQVQRHVQLLEQKNLKKGDQCDTSFSKGSLDAALCASGAVCHAIDKVVAKKITKCVLCDSPAWSPCRY
mmetsp:Transcript_31121/g.49869  ORF Transcript_31121/g.49869 Transcript_31121/m.49869 type:complete len:512 (+) Transcript_31121:114-1649(+)